MYATRFLPKNTEVDKNRAYRLVILNKTPSNTCGDLELHQSTFTLKALQCNIDAPEHHFNSQNNFVGPKSSNTEETSLHARAGSNCLVNFQGGWTQGGVGVAAGIAELGNVLGTLLRDSDPADCA